MSSYTQTCYTITLISMFWFKASTWSAGYGNLRGKITAEQGLSDSINTDHFIYHSCLSRFPTHVTHASTYGKKSLFYSILVSRFSVLLLLFLFFLPCCRWRFPKWEKLLCRLFQDSSAPDASLCLLGNKITIQYVENKQMQNPQLFVFLTCTGHMELGCCKHCINFKYSHSHREGSDTSQKLETVFPQTFHRFNIFSSWCCNLFRFWILDQRLM